MLSFNQFSKPFVSMNQQAGDPNERSDVPMTRQRRARIAEYVQNHGSARVAELAREFRTSEVTIRNDLTHLEDQGQLVRDRGGAVAAQRTLSSLLAVEERAGIRIEDKRRVARAAAKLVSAGDTIFLDAGTTAVEMAPHLAAIENLTVVTYGVNVALQVGAQTSARVILAGGTLNRESSSLLGPVAERQLGELSVQKLFLGTQALDLEQGLTDTTYEIAQVKQRMIQSAREVILTTDSGKWGSVGFVRVAPISAMDTIITDPGLPEKARTAIEALGVKLVIV